jgi:hypothetical protein
MEDLKQFISTCSDSELNNFSSNIDDKKLKAIATKDDILWHKLNRMADLITKEIRTRVDNTTLEEYKDLLYNNI